MEIVSEARNSAEGNQTSLRTALRRKSFSESRVNEVPVSAGCFAGQEHDRVEEQALKYGAAHVIHLFVPVSICMAVVILTTLTVGYYTRDDHVHLVYTPFIPDDADKQDTGKQLLMSFGNAFTLLAFVIVMTVVLILLYKFRFYKIIYGWLIMSSLILLSMFTIMYLQELLKNYNIPIDYFTLFFIIWNWASMGMICIHWKGPLILQQGYLISMSALMALVFIKYLPEWTVWTVLGVLSVWDLVAVLCPKGPLRILVETAQERNEPLFAGLIYSSAILYPYTLIMMTMTEPPPVVVAAAASSHDGGEQGTSTSSTFELLERTIQNNNNNNGDGDEHNTETEHVPPANTNNNTTSAAQSSSRIAPNRKPMMNNAAARMNNAAAPAAAANSTVRMGNNNPTMSGAGGSGGDKASRARALSPGRRAHSDTELSGPDVVEVEERGIKLGLGDFIFYSVLVGKASSYGDWNTTIACYIAILVGLAFTLMLLALFRKALPALPISIFAGITFFFATRHIITPFTTELSMNQYLL